MNWNYNTETGVYVMVAGLCTVNVWQDANNHWATTIECGRRCMSRAGFMSLGAAQGWAEEQAAQINAADRRRQSRDEHSNAPTTHIV